jgi:RNA-directed DNA polymerase
MAVRPNTPEAKVRRLQRRLYVAARRSSARRFRARYDRTLRGDVLREAWERAEKARLVDLRRGREGSTFRGCMIRKRRSIPRRPDLHFLHRWPSPKAMQRVRERVHELTDVRCPAGDVKELITLPNPVLRGWGNYFRTGAADQEFNKLDDHVHERVTRWQWRRGGQRARYRLSAWPRARLCSMGLYRLQGTVCHPVQATSRRSSVSRVREIRTHGLNGAAAYGAAQ